MCSLALLLSALRADAADGFYDPTFGSGGRHLDAVYTKGYGLRLHILTDGTLLVGGTCFGHVAATDTTCLAWFRNDGKTTADAYGATGNGTTFLDNFSGFPQYGALRDMAVLPDDRIVLLAWDESGLNGYFIAIVNADGKDFDHGVAGGKGWTTVDFGGTSNVNALAVQKDGKILVAGAVSNQNTVSFDMAVARLTADLSNNDPLFNGGQPKTIAFNLGGTNAESARAIVLQADNKIVVAGSADTGVAANDLAFARLLPDGSPDNSTNSPGLGFGPLQDGRAHFSLGGPSPDLSAILSDRHGRIVFGGDTTLSSMWLIGRLLADGSALDPAFNGGSAQTFLLQPAVTGFQSVTMLARQSDDKIVATGSGPRTVAPGPNYWGAARLLDDGSLDNSFGFFGRGVGTFTDSSMGCCGYTDSGSALAIGDGGIVFAGYGEPTDADPPEFGIARVLLDLIFTDRFE